MIYKTLDGMYVDTDYEAGFVATDWFPDPETLAACGGIEDALTWCFF